MDTETDVLANKYLDNLLENGIKKPVDEGIEALEDMDIPPWFDASKFKRAQQFYNDNLFAMQAGKLLGLLAVLSIPSILKVLVYTKESGNPLTAYRRYIATIFHTQTWYDYKMAPGSTAWRSLVSVRKRHLLASQMSSKAKAGMITQKDMALTQFGFMGFIVLHAKYLGIQGTPSDFDAFVHFWRVIGYLIGIQDEFNLCANNFKDTERRLNAVVDRVYRPSLSKTTQTFYEMSDAMIEGLWCFNPFLVTDTFLFFLRRLCGCEGYYYFESERKGCTVKPAYQKLEGWSRLVLCMMIHTHQVLLNYTIFRLYFNLQIHIANFLIKWFPFLAFYKFGIKNSFVRIMQKN